MTSSNQPILYFEPVGGIAGDMFLAAAIDLGVSPEAITEALSGLHLGGWKLQPSRAIRHTITGVHLQVVVEQHDHAHHRAYSEICERIRNAETLSATAKDRALAIFKVIGDEEAKIHGVPLEQVHFHEVGAVDSIVDICGAAVVIDLLGNPAVYCAPPPLGSGRVKTAHGYIPLPAPATLAILRGVPVRFEGQGELTTPTGAALVKVLCRVEAPPPFIIDKVGYGMGTQDFPDRANLLRASLGRISSTQATGDGHFLLEVNLDDCNPQFLGSLLEKLLEQGALDAYVLPATMKKGRPGHLLAVLGEHAQREALTELIFAETTTLGVRWYPVFRTELDRAFKTVETRYGAVRIKVGSRAGRQFNAAPEFEDCRRLSAGAKVPVKTIWAEALATYYSRAKQ